MSTASNLSKGIDIIDKNVFNVVLSIFNDYKSIDSICHETNISKLKVQQILNLLNENKLIITNFDIDSNNMIKKMYKLQEDLDIIDDGKLSNTIETIKYFSNVVKELINNIYTDEFGIANNIIIKCDKGTVNEFLKDYNKLLAKFKSIEDKNSNETYAFVSAVGKFKRL